MHILVTGGAGYIGSHMVKRLAAAGHRVTVLDDLSLGFRDAVVGAELVEVDLLDEGALERLFAGASFEAVIHFAGLSQVGESMREPERYRRVNVAGSRNLIEAMGRHGVDTLVFSSSAAVYGEPQSERLEERHPTRPINPYGAGKLAVEELLANQRGIRWCALRYFNAAGADPEGELGERHDPETHLIPLVLGAALGRRPALTLFGDDYPTRDGTCVRDYVHVADLCEAHLLALEYLKSGGESRPFNLGNGSGFTNREVIETARRVTGRDIPLKVGPRRAGDPAVLVAEAGEAQRLLGWRPRYPELERIIAHAWAWEQKRPL